MKKKVLWEKQAQADREKVWLYLYEEAGLEVANSADDRFAEAASLLENAPEAGVKVGYARRRKLVLARMPFIIVYVYEAEVKEVRILRLLHTSRKLAGRYSL